MRPLALPMLWGDRGDASSEQLAQTNAKLRNEDGKRLGIKDPWNGQFAPISFCVEVFRQASLRHDNTHETGN
jgi:hypothetical protein